MGNMEGMSLLQTLETIKSDFRKQETTLERMQSDLCQQDTTLERVQSDIRQLKTTSHTIRASTLDEWAGINSDCIDRNGFMHGGNILGDISIISHMDTIDPDIKKTQIWKDVFRKNYGVSFSTCANSNGLRQADDRLIEIFNIYANTNVLHRWKRPEATDTTQKIQSCGLKIIIAWFTKGNNIFEDPSTLDHYKTAVGLHYFTRDK